MSHGLYQGDVVSFPLPGKYAAILDRSDPVPLENGRIILARGEATGHHHSLHIGMQPTMLAETEGAGSITGLIREKILGLPQEAEETAISENETAELLAGVLGRRPETRAEVRTETAAEPAAAMFLDPKLAALLVSDGVLETAELCVGFLVVNSQEGAPLTHQEHGPIDIPRSIRYVGMQRQMVGATVRLVED